MKILDKKIQDKIDELSNKSYEYYEKNQKEKSYQLMKDAFELYPLPKEQWSESYNTAKYTFDDLLKDKKIDEAKNWINFMIKHNNLHHHSDDEVLFYSAKYLYETKDYQKAKEYFERVVKEAGFRYFEDENPKYLDFYKNPEKYIKS